MKQLLGRMLILPLLSGSSMAAALDADEVFSKVSESIVSVVAARNQSETLRGGSGVVIAPGEIITSCAVIQSADVIAIARGSFKTQATVRFSDPKRDLCQLSAANDDGFSAAVTISSNFLDLRVGSKVYAIGAPHGLELTLTDGLISSLRPEKIGTEIQSTVSIWPGSSGGGLFDSSGTLIGITRFSAFQDRALSNAVSSHWIAGIASRTVDLIKTGKMRAEIERRCEAQEQRRRIETFWGEEPVTVIDSRCERLRIENELKQLEAEQRRVEQRQLAREREAKERATTQARARQRALVNDYIARIQAKIRSRVHLPPNMPGNPEAVYEVTMVPGGGVLQADLTKSSGVSPYDDAVLRAIMAAQPLPVPSEPALFHQYFRRITLKFRPRE